MLCYSLALSASQIVPTLGCLAVPGVAEYIPAETIQILLALVTQTILARVINSNNRKARPTVVWSRKLAMPLAAKCVPPFVYAPDLIAPAHAFGVYAPGTTPDLQGSSTLGSPVRRSGRR